MTIEPELSAAPQPSVTLPLPNILLQGFALARRNWPLIVWAYAVDLVFALLAGVPFSSGLAPILDHSLAAQRIAGTVDLAALTELAFRLREVRFAQTVLSLANWLLLLQLLILFLLFAGALWVYLSAEPPRISALARGGAAFFWRFVRGTLMAVCIAGVILGLLLTARSALLAQLAQVYFGRALFAYTALTGGVIFFIALLLRLWFDLVELYIVRNTLSGELRARRALLPAGKLLVSFFFRIFGSFLLAGLAGTSALAVSILLWKALPANSVWLAILLAQVGLFVLLASRFWQRGLEAALLLAVDPPILLVEETIEVDQEQEAPSLEGVAGISGLSEPTLRELVLKLRTEPWALPADTTPRPKPAPEPAPQEIGPRSAAPDARANLGSVATLSTEEEIVQQRHAAKMPLGGPASAKEPESPEASKPDEEPPSPTGKPVP